jgi:uncharacterized membrane protein
MNPFDWRTVLLAKHAQHVVLIHFPIALFIAGVAFDVLGLRLRRQEFAAVAYYNLSLAALFAIPTAVSGMIAKQLLLEGHKFKGILLYHVMAALTATLLILLSWLLHFRARRAPAFQPPSWRIPLELIGVLLLILAGHFGGFLSGVNITP